MSITVGKVALRDGRACVHCGRDDMLTVQHRAVKGMGGRDSADVPSNVVILDWHFNTLIESNAHAAAEAVRMGWKVSTHADTTVEPFWDVVTGAWWRLDDAWHRERVDGPDPIWGYGPEGPDPLAWGDTPEDHDPLAPLW